MRQKEEEDLKMGRDWDITHAEDDDDLKEKGGLGHGSRCWS